MYNGKLTKQILDLMAEYEAIFNDIFPLMEVSLTEVELIEALKTCISNKEVFISGQLT